MGYVMSSWLFTTSINWVLREARTRCGKRIMKLFKNSEEWNLPMFVNVYEIVLVAENGSDFKMMIKCFHLLCGRR